MIKRERKLLDYTRSKRSLDSLKKGEKISPEKLGLAQDDYTQNKMIYEEVNSELCDDLPELWNRFIMTAYPMHEGDLGYWPNIGLRKLGG